MTDLIAIARECGAVTYLSHPGLVVMNTVRLAAFAARLTTPDRERLEWFLQSRSDMPATIEAWRKAEDVPSADAYHAMSALERFVYDWQSGHDQDDWRRDLAAVLREAAPAAPAVPTDKQILALVSAHGTGGWQTAQDMARFARAVLALAPEQAAPVQAPASDFDAVWRTLPVPGEYDSMDAFDQQRWRGIARAAFDAGLAAALSASQGGKS